MTAVKEVEVVGGVTNRLAKSEERRNKERGRRSDIILKFGRQTLKPLGG